MDIRLSSGQVTFGLRAAAVILRDGHILLQHEAGDAAYALPGGTVQLGETCQAALLRECREELRTEAQVGRLLWTEESFWVHQEHTHQSLCLYYQAQLDAAIPDGMPQGDNADILFRWLPVEELSGHTVYPVWLAKELTRLEDGPKHFVTFDE